MHTRDVGNTAADSLHIHRGQHCHVDQLASGQSERSRIPREKHRRIPPVRNLTEGPTSNLVLSTACPGRLCLWAYRLFSTGDRLGKNVEIRANFIKNWGK